MKRNLFVVRFLILFLFIFISLSLISCNATTKNGSTTTSNTVAVNNSLKTISDTTATENETVFNLSIANGAGITGLAKKTAELFKKIKYPDGKDKYNIVHITNTDKYNYENTQIICKSEDSIIKKAAENIKTILEVGIITTESGTSKDTDIAIIIGKDYSMPSEVTTTETAVEATTETTLTSNMAFEEIGTQGLFVFIYTEATKRTELQQIVDIYKNDKFKSKRIFELDFFNNRGKALDAKTNFGMMLPDATYNYNANIGLDELLLYN